jgi:hypothetical protein
MKLHPLMTIYGSSRVYASWCRYRPVPVGMGRSISPPINITRLEDPLISGSPPPIF